MLWAFIHNDFILVKNPLIFTQFVEVMILIILFSFPAITVLDEKSFNIFMRN